LNEFAEDLRKIWLGLKTRVVFKAKLALVTQECSTVAGILPNLRNGKEGLLAMKRKVTITFETYEVSTIRVKRNRDAADSDVPDVCSYSSDTDDPSGSANYPPAVVRGDLGDSGIEEVDV
jgi:hypothetical protein